MLRVSSLNYFRLPVTSRRKAAHGSTSKRDVVDEKTEEVTKPEATEQQVVLKTW